jgi:hypothetical protein
VEVIYETTAILSALGALACVRLEVRSVFAVQSDIEGFSKQELTPCIQSCSGEKFISYRTPPHRQPPVTLWGVISIDVAAIMLIETQKSLL